MTFQLAITSSTLLKPVGTLVVTVQDSLVPMLTAPTDSDADPTNGPQTAI